jgi:hypothetical protein
LPFPQDSAEKKSGYGCEAEGLIKNESASAGEPADDASDEVEMGEKIELGDDAMLMSSEE